MHDVKLLPIVALVQSLLAASAPAAPPGSADGVRSIEAVASSLVRVAHAFRHDRGEAPSGGLWRFRCPNCGRTHTDDASDLLDQERAGERVGFVVAPDMVLTAAPLIHSRFLRSIEVIAGDRRVTARPVRYAMRQNAVMLGTETPLQVRPLKLDGGAPGPYSSVTMTHDGGDWTLRAAPLPAAVSQREGEAPYIAVPSECVVVSGQGTPVALAMNEELAVGSWQGPFEQWEWIETAELDRRLDRLAAWVDDRIVRVSMSFRSPRRGDRMGLMRFEEDAATDTAQRDVPGLVLPGGRLLVLALLKPQTTARLELLRVHPSGRGPVTARFIASLADYGAFVAELEEAADAADSQRAGDIRDHRHELLLAAEVRIQGENRVTYLGPTRIASLSRGWQDRVFPEVIGDNGQQFLFALDGTLLALPLSRRAPVTAEARWDDEEPVLTPMAMLWPVLDDLEHHQDPDNRPLSEAEENRLAWLGVELQALDQDLARMHGVSDQTRDGQTGALVVHVYPGSPAERAGIEAGDILLRLHIEGHARPLEVTVQDLLGMGMGMGAFPWEHWDDLPEEYFDQVPTPWPPVDNQLNRSLTELGFGTPFTVELVRDGATSRLQFTVAQGPAHHDSAAQHESVDLGLTVRELTYEVRRYFQLDATEPGVIVATLEPGSKASVAGLRPFEIILSVDGEPVHDVAAFAEAIAPPGRHRLSVRRMTEGRIVMVGTEGGRERD
jgi:hypothetical protein